jgi:hypothetical protein
VIFLYKHTPYYNHIHPPIILPFPLFPSHFLFSNSPLLLWGNLFPLDSTWERKYAMVVFMILVYFLTWWSPVLSIFLQMKWFWYLWLNNAPLFIYITLTLLFIQWWACIVNNATIKWVYMHLYFMLPLILSGI